MWNDEIAVDKQVSIDHYWKVLDKNWNWYNKVKFVWKVSKVHLTKLLQPWIPDASNIAATAFMRHKKSWANAILRSTRWSITEAIVQDDIEEQVLNLFLYLNNKITLSMALPQL